GSLTNLALAIMAAPEIVPLVKRAVVMGGAVTVPGNRTPVAEANIWGDPEAARVLFRSGTPFTMVGLDVTMKALLHKRHLDTLPADLPYARLLQEAVEFYMRAYEDAQEAEALWCPLHDPLAVAVAEDPSICVTKPYHVAVETQGRLTAGMTVVDGRRRPDQPANARVCVKVDAPRFEARFCSRLGMDWQGSRTEERDSD
ncbi:MAG: nucleoside hydrolase, partial [Alicyclobacillus sp.]|nr:nucleoside hydrolase [Alicyclobacillus sp.]